jgi:hypothetical protein
MGLETPTPIQVGYVLVDTYQPTFVRSLSSCDTQYCVFCILFLVLYTILSSLFIYSYPFTLPPLTITL